MRTRIIVAAREPEPDSGAMPLQARLGEERQQATTSPVQLFPQRRLEGSSEFPSCRSMASILRFAFVACGATIFPAD